MTGLDWVIVLVVVLSVLMAAAKGFFFQMFSLAGTLIGFVLAAWQYKTAAQWVEPYVKSASIAEFVGFLVLFFAVFLLAGIVGTIARWAIKEAGLEAADRLLGAAFGLVRGVVLVVVVVTAWASFAPQSKALADSELARYALLGGRVATYVAPGEVRSRFLAGIDALREMRYAAVKPADAKPVSSPPPAAPRNSASK